ncbi:unnamed protein product [Moneuplotes crassus]|uniref:Uncharacterized protein n=1 Tax=Euplotes crassus TaxID=5936 RepID=A0AAD1Y9W7_EUPCR|nr:unnamed protein product [Moneuplotes crassus]
MYRSPFDPLLPHNPRIYSITHSCERPRIHRAPPYSFTPWSAFKTNRCKLCEKPLRACREELSQRVQKKYDCLPSQHGVYYDCYQTFEELHPDTTEGEEEQEEEEMIYQYEETEVSESDSEDLPFEEMPEEKQEAKLQSSVVTEEVFRENFMKTYYFEKFSETERMPALEEVIEDLRELFKNIPKIKAYVEKAFDTHKYDGARMVVTKLWTSSDDFTKTLNAGLALDAVATFGEEVFKGAQFYESVLAKYGKNYKEVIDKSIKYMRLLNTYIVELGSEANTEDRVVYRGVPAGVLRRIKPGENFRYITWGCASDDLDTAQGFMNGTATGNQVTAEDTKKTTMLKFNIKQGCYNAGKINEIGVSQYGSENETLIPPYSGAVCLKKEVIEMDSVALESFETEQTLDATGEKEVTEEPFPKEESKTSAESPTKTPPNHNPNTRNDDKASP